MMDKHCKACTTNVSSVWDNKERVLNYTSDGDGPFCDTCWFFICHIETLKDRVTDLEKNCYACAVDRPLHCERHSKGEIE